VIVYLDSSVLVRAYLSDEKGHDGALTLLLDQDMPAVTGRWTLIEVSGTIVRAVRARRSALSEDELLGLLDNDLADGGLVTVLSAPEPEVEAATLRLVRTHGLRAMDAWHLATAQLTVPPLAEPGDPVGFASRDDAQRAVALNLGFQPC
jgi:predicted nucleic acid-binding protein